MQRGVMAHSSSCSAITAPMSLITEPRGGEDADDVAATADLPVQSFLGVVGPDLFPVFFGEPGERQQVGRSLVQVLGGFG